MMEDEFLELEEELQDFNRRHPAPASNNRDFEIPSWIDDCREPNPPFTWFGGKRKIAGLVWEKFGANIPNYIEPFAGGLAVLLHRPIEDLSEFEKFYEVFNDQNLFLLNFWRAVQYGDHAELIKYADFPAHETELLARHRQLVEKHRDLPDEAKSEVAYEIEEIELLAWQKHLIGNDQFEADLTQYNIFDTEVAGLWLYVTRNWIGTGADDPDIYPQLKMPSKIRKGWFGGSPEAHLACLRQRLKRALGFVGDWKRVVKSKTQTTDRGTTGVFLDPPYRGTEDYYAGVSKKKPERSSIADQVDVWAFEHGADENFRIAVCGYEHNFNLEEYQKRGWHLHRWKASIGFHSGKKDIAERKQSQEIIAFSPPC